MTAIKPFKGCKREEMDSVPLPCALSFKIDGIRGLCYDDRFNSTSGKALRNKQIQVAYGHVAHLMTGLDGEIIDGNPNDKNVMQAATTAAMNTDAVTDFTFWVFDDFSIGGRPFSERYAQYQSRVAVINEALEKAGYRPFLRAVEYREINSMADYEAMQQEAAALGYEGLYGKDWLKPYKHGRGTPKDKSCWKDKPWTDEEGVIHEVIEMMENTNEAFEDEFGNTKRSTSSEGLVGKGYAGAFVVTNPKYVDEDGKQIPFRVSLGTMTMAERKHVWELKDTYPGKLVTYKFFDFGVVDVPRSALYKSLRFPEDTTDY